MNVAMLIAILPAKYETWCPCCPKYPDVEHYALCLLHGRVSWPRPRTIFEKTS